VLQCFSEALHVGFGGTNLAHAEENRDFESFEVESTLSGPPVHFVCGIFAKIKDHADRHEKIRKQLDTIVLVCVKTNPVTD
jgi:hypothetical protein